MSLWKVARIDVHKLEDGRLKETLAWVSRFFDVMRIRPTFAISQDETDRSYRLHLSKFVYDETGEKVMDLAAGQPHTEPLVIPITDWPAWLAEESRRQGEN